MSKRCLAVNIFLSVLFCATCSYAQFGLQDGDGATLSTDEKPVEAKARLVLAAPEAVSVGEPFLVRLTSTRVLEEAVVYWLGKEVMPAISVWNDKHVAMTMLGTDVLNAKPGPVDLVVTASIDGVRKTFKKVVNVQGKKFPRQDLSLPKKMVTPPQAVYDRIAKERKIITKARNTISPERQWTLPFLRPVEGKVTSIYGLQRFLNKKPKYPHRGMDFRAPTGTPIKCVANGKVILVGNHYYAGNSAYVDHGNGVVSMYFHMSEVKVKTGDTVQRGDVLGLSGSTGRSTGPHLHLSIGVLGKLVDPAPLFVAKPESLLE